ncbi:MAG: protein translocase subunit SecD [Actinobacteria bacterium]|nr:protein translocase subunit SecD [Actinomycetota bacterium]
MSTASRWRAVAAVIAVAAAAAITFTRPVRLGLDLEGGTQIVLEAQDTERVQVDADVGSRTLEVLRRRVDALGVAEPTLQRSGERRIIVELPGVTDPDEAVEVIGRTAQLEFRPVLGLDAGGPGMPPTEASADPQAGEGEVFESEDGDRLRLGPPQVTGEAVGSAQAGLAGDLGALWQVEVSFAGEGGDQFAELTGQAACAPAGDPRRSVAIVLDREVISSPQVSPEIGCGQGISGGETVITGQFSESEAKDLALLIRAGALPVPVEIIEQRTIGPTLGEAAIRASVQAALIGAALTVLYMIAYYRLLGALAALALMLYGLMAYAALLAIGATLTLPGIAGFILAIGMAVDANVLVFERTKDEHVAGRGARSAARAGFRRAWSAIADSNATTLLAAVLLFFFASGAVRGFGITLSIGVIVSMFAALVVTRSLVELVLRRRRVAMAPRALGLEVGGRLRRWLSDRGPDLIGRRRLWFTISAAVLMVAVAGIVTRGLNYGLDFSGGRLLEYETERAVDLNGLRDELAGRGLPRAVVQESGQGNVAVRTGQLTPAQEQAVGDAVGAVGGEHRELRDEFVGPTIGDELRRKAFIALGVALVAQMAYLAVRFRWTYAAAAVAAMFHDVAILLGVFAWLGKELDGVFLAALLTVIGYSINDSVVVFDRIREQRRGRARDALATVANDACLQTIPRTVNTGLGALFILVALYFLGGDTLTNFALALLIGIVVGTYSSIFTAAPLAVALERPGPTTPRRAAPPLKRPATAEAPDTRADDAPTDDGAHGEPVLVPARPPGAIAARPRKKKRRGGGRPR